MNIYPLRGEPEGTCILIIAIIQTESIATIMAFLASFFVDTKERLDVLIFEYGNRQKKAAFCHNPAGGGGSAKVRF